MAVVERYLEGLKALKAQVSVESLTTVPDAEKNAYGYGKACGRLEGIALAERLFEDLLSEQEEAESGVSRRSRTAKTE